MFLSQAGRIKQLYLDTVKKQWEQETTRMLPSQNQVCADLEGSYSRATIQKLADLGAADFPGHTVTFRRVPGDSEYGTSSGWVLILRAR